MLQQSNNRVKITLLVENTSLQRGILGEHGLAYWIEKGSHRLLFDSGQSGIIEHNAGMLNIPLNQTEAIILSHGHYDHTGGIPAVFKHVTPDRCFIHPRAFEPKYSRHVKQTVRDVGMPQTSRDTLSQSACRIIETDKPTQITCGLYVTGPIPRKHEFENTGGEFYLDENAKRSDPLLDDQAVYINTIHGTVVLLGCAHAGLINTLDYIKSLTNNTTIYAVIGGMHLTKASNTRMDNTISALQKEKIHYLIPVHCTGYPAVLKLWNAFSYRCRPGFAGMRIEFECP